MPVTVTLGGEKYPEDAKEKAMRKAGILVWVEALKIAKKPDNAKASNVALLGASSPFLDPQRRNVSEPSRLGLRLKH
jgi:hypothetical protein